MPSPSGTRAAGPRDRRRLSRSYKPRHGAPRPRLPFRLRAGALTRSASALPLANRRSEPISARRPVAQSKRGYGSFRPRAAARNAVNGKQGFQPDGRCVRRVYGAPSCASGEMRDGRHLPCRGRVARGNLTPGLPQNPGVTVSRHRALLTSYQYARTHRQWANRPGCLESSPVHHRLNRLKVRSRLYFFPAQRLR